MTKTALGIAVAAAMATTTMGARAQETTTQAGGQASGQVTVAPPAAPAPVTTTAPAVRVEDETPDHERFVGHFAVGYFGISQLPIAHEAAGGGAAALARDNVSAPVIGIRYWLQRNIGIDAGLGLGWSGGSTEVVQNNTTTSIDHKSLLGVALHGGVPIAFAHGRHYSFLLVPEATVGFTSGTFKDPAGNAPDQNLSGFRLDLGARVGAEIHFGFIGIPELSLEGSVGLYARREAIKWKQGDSSASDGTTTLTTSVQADPWALFVNNISAFYYF